MVRRVALTLLCMAGLACTASTPTTTFEVDVPTGEPAPWTSLAPQDDPQDFHFVVVSDRTGGHRPGVFKGAMGKINLLAPAFVVSVGDLIEGYTDNQARIDAEWDEMEGFVEQLEAPFFYAAGNHDMNNAVMANTWQRRFGPSFYKFEYKEVLFVVLNSELFGMVGAPDTPLPGPWTQAQQMAFVEDTLTAHTDARWTIVLLHQPLWDSREIDADWLQIEEWLGERRYTVFAGHFHQYAKRQRHDRNYITLATTGGGSGLRGTPFGEFDHVAWITMREDGPLIANLLLEGIQDEDVSTPELAGRAQEITAAIRTQPALGQGATFRSATQRISVSNPTDGVVRYAPLVSKAGNFAVDGLRAVALEPGESTTLALSLSADEPTPYRDLVAAELTWRVDAGIGELSTRTPVLPLTRHPLPRRDDAPSIDGDLGDWRDLPYRVDRQGDIATPEFAAADLSYRFAVAEDAEALYVAVTVIDDEVLIEPGALARDQDAITLSVDVRDDAARNRSMGVGEAVLGGDMAQLAMLIKSVGAASPDRLLGFMDETLAVSGAAVVRTDRGYDAEFAIPLTYINNKAGRDDWTVARIAVSVYDKDSGDHAPATLHWQPYRYGAGAMPWTHTFQRASR
ncbi:MAG: metallophosphoesterase [Pseudomonadota bacterium]